MLTGWLAALMHRIAGALRPAAADRRGSALVELAVLGGVAAVVGVMAVTTVGSGIRGLYDSVSVATATPR